MALVFVGIAEVTLMLYWHFQNANKKYLCVELKILLFNLNSKIFSDRIILKLNFNLRNSSRLSTYRRNMQIKGANNNTGAFV